MSGKVLFLTRPKKSLNRIFVILEHIWACKTCSTHIRGIYNTTNLCIDYVQCLQYAGMCMCMCMCMWWCVHVCACVCMCTCTCIRIRIYVCVCECVCVCLFLYVYFYVYVYVVWVCVCVCVYMCVCVCLYMNSMYTSFLITKIYTRLKHYFTRDRVL